MKKDKEFIFPTKPVVVVDIEGNGQTPPDLIEISILKFDSNSKSKHESYTWLIKPQKPIKKAVTKIHGIKNSDVASSSIWSDVKDEVSLHLKGAWFVAHHAKGDYAVIKRHLPEWEPVGIIDTLRFARHILPNAPGYSLEKLMNFTGLLLNSADSFHRADFDAQATFELLVFLIDKSGYTHWDEVCNVSQINISLNKENNLPTQGELW